MIHWVAVWWLAGPAIGFSLIAELFGYVTITVITFAGIVAWGIKFGYPNPHTLYTACALVAVWAVIRLIWEHGE